MGKDGGEGSSGLYRSSPFYGDSGKEVLVVTQLEVAPLASLRCQSRSSTLAQTRAE
jgi:hypothetical protein